MSAEVESRPHGNDEFDDDDDLPQDLNGDHASVDDADLFGDDEDDLDQPNEYGETLSLFCPPR